MSAEVTTEQRVLTYEHDFREFVSAVNTGALLEIDREMFNYFLNVLPTKGEHMTVEVGGAVRFVDFLQAEGYEELTAFWIEGSGATARYFCQQTEIMNPYA